MPEVDPQPRVACLKFLFVSPSDALIAEQLQAMRRYDPLVVATSMPDSLGLPPEAIRSLSGLNPVARAFNRLALKLAHSCPYFEDQVRREGCRLVHAQTALEGLYGLRLKARSQLPLVTSFQGGDGSRLPRHRPRMYERLFAEGDLFLACSQATRKHLLSLGCPDALLRVHHPGVNVQRIPFHERRPADDGVVNILLVGQMVERKGIPYALQAFANVHRYHRRTSLTVIGDGPARPVVEATLRELNLPEVRLLGTQPREVVLGEMQRAHICIQPSVTGPDGDAEGVPFALLEAQASGLPVISTWHAAIPEVVADGRSGYLVSERNSHALAERLRHLVEHPELWGALGRAGRAIIERQFNLQRQVAVLESYYDELLPTPDGG